MAAVAPVITGAALAFNSNKFSILATTIALLCSLLIQIATNFVNDLYDHLKGSDTKERRGPTRVLAAGLITEKEMRVAIKITFLLAFLLGLILVNIGGWIILAIGIVSLISGYAYTAGPFPLAYNGLGDVFVFFFFGIVATTGTFYVNTLEFSTIALLASIPVGALITNILVVNNYRDIEEDRSNGKKTLAVLWGPVFTRYQYLIGIIISYAILIPIYFYYISSIFIFLPIVSIPLAVKLIKMIFNFHGASLNKTLELTARFSMLYGFLFSLGLVL